MTTEEPGAQDRERTTDPGGGTSRDAELLSSLGPGLSNNLLGATMRSPNSVEDLGEDRRHDRLAAWVAFGIFVGLAVALGLFLALR